MPKIAATGQESSAIGHAYIELIDFSPEDTGQAIASAMLLEHTADGTITHAFHATPILFPPHCRRAICAHMPWSKTGSTPIAKRI